MRVASLDITPTHLSFALSDISRRTAAPFGILARTKSAIIDSKLLTPAFAKAAEFENTSSLNIGGLVIGVPPTQDDAKRSIAYARELLQENVSELSSLFPDLQGCILYSEAHALRHTLKERHDFADAINLLPDRLESKRRSHYEVAMYPVITKDDLVDDLSSRARISASEILQVMLNEMFKLDRSSESYSMQNT